MWNKLSASNLSKPVCIIFRQFSNSRLPFSRDKIDSSLNGVLIPVPTPFREDENQSVDYEKLRQNITKWEKLPLKGYCIGGTNGEWPLLSDDEKLTLIKIIKQSVHSSKLIVAGTTCESTESTITLSHLATEAGADLIMAMTPHYFRSEMTENVILEHFVKIADKISVPLMIYNNPFSTGIDLSVNCIQRLADHPNICGIKDTGVAKIGYIVEKTKGKNFHVLAGSAGYLLPSLLMGCSGGINGLAAILGQPICDMFTLAKENKWPEASTIQKRLAIPDFTILRESGPSGLKFAMDLMGYYGGICRKPLQPANEKMKNKIHQALSIYEFLP